MRSGLVNAARRRLSTTRRVLASAFYVLLFIDIRIHSRVFEEECCVRGNCMIYP